jgi:hypothetical protein
MIDHKLAFKEEVKILADLVQNFIVEIICYIIAFLFELGSEYKLDKIMIKTIYWY